MENGQNVYDIPANIPPPLERTAELLRGIIQKAAKSPRNTQKILHLISRSIKILNTLRAPFSEPPSDLYERITAMESLSKLEFGTACVIYKGVEGNLFNPPTDWKDDLDEVARVDDHLWVGLIAHDLWTNGKNLGRAQEAERTATQLLELPTSRMEASQRKRDIEATMTFWEHAQEGAPSSVGRFSNSSKPSVGLHRSGSSSRRPSSPVPSRRGSPAPRGTPSGVEPLREGFSTNDRVIFEEVPRGVTSQQTAILTRRKTYDGSPLPQNERVGSAGTAPSITSMRVPLSRASELSLLGDTFSDQGNYTQAEQYYTQAKEIFARFGDDLGRASTLKALGDLYSAQSQYAQAEELYTQTKEVYASLGNDQGLASTLKTLGDFYSAQSNYAQAEELYTQAKEIYASLGDDQGRANTLKALGDLYSAQSQYAQAEEPYTQAEEIYARLGNHHGLARMLEAIGSF
ncbi:hypothetical protein M407DRAFT_19694 [Tulasnella calospora MUT 4182]|uniref:Uncharacterized protein n=1 Tax=Tulasnella calospora MUT 4182 TaxID=1051891 RepID=A0A0C3QT78_9AGAM|nr:hypothetical protein M407DRAFT_19694 [Tulasnella calospora MUT 4182]